MICLLLSGCEKADEAIHTSRENFDTLWKIIDEHYCFFEYKQIDWDEVYQKYSPQVSDTLDQFSLFNLFGEMLAELKDGHTNLISSFNISRYWAWYEDYPPNFYPEIQKKYLGKSTEHLQAGGIKYRRIAEDKIGYLYYDSFTNAVGESNLDYILQHFSDCKGLIIDIRDNGGGALTNSDCIASRFVHKKTLTGYIQHKTGKGHDAFSDPHEVYLTPSSRIRWSKPVVILTNRHCYSAANDFVLKMKTIARTSQTLIVVIGDKTGGGSGFPFTSELPNGWSIRFSSSPMLDANKQHIEFGIDPDISVNMKAQDLVDGKDTIIETGIEYILSLPD